MNKKQRLLKQYRQRKRLLLIALAIAFFILLTLSIVYPLLLPSIPLLILCIWLGHEAYLSDHLFYAPSQDYQYHFPDEATHLIGHLVNGQLIIETDQLSDNIETLFLSVQIKSTLMGYFLDPSIVIKHEQGQDCQTFERGANGLRYLNLSGLTTALKKNLITIETRHCQLLSDIHLYSFSNPDYTNQSMMIIAPHADDAELAAFGQYSRCQKTSIITLTQGEIEASYYQDTLHLTKEKAAQLKGQLRSWDSVAIPLWGGVPINHCIQLGYYCLQLKKMHQSPQEPFGSKESGEQDTRTARRFNSLSLPTDKDGVPSWHNLLQDMVMLIDHFKPEVIVSPHPYLDPHEDHIQATLLIEEALKQTTWQPNVQLFYANHLHDNDRWPMGDTGHGIALPPSTEVLPAYSLWSPILDKTTQTNKAIALAMQHDLISPLPYKKKLRRIIQTYLAGRQWPKTGTSEFFRKAVRKHELFWVKK